MTIKSAKLKNTGEKLSGNAFFYVLILSIINVIVDIISSTAMNEVTNWWLYQITMTLYVLTMPLLAAAWVSYTYVVIHRGESINTLKKPVSFIMAPYFVYALIGLSNPFTGLFFRLSANMEYSRGILFMPLGVGFIMLYSLIGVIMVWFNRHKIFPRSNILLMASFFISTAISIWVQLANPGWLIINACYAIVYVWCDMTLEEQRRKVLYEKIKKQNLQLEEIAQKAEQAAQ